MAVACASRFAVLKLEDDELADSNSLVSRNKKNVKQALKNKTGNGKTVIPAAENKNKNKKKKKANSNGISELQSLAFGNGVNKTKTKGGNQGQNVACPPSKHQWEEWKKKDKEFVAETYEQDLQEALLRSKIEYEEKKDVYNAVQKESVTKQIPQNQKKKRKNSQKKEKGTMSLDEFQSLLPSQIESGNYHRASNSEEPEEKPTPVNESDFFEKIEEDAEKIIVKEQRQESFKNMTPPSRNARDLQYKEELKEKDVKICTLTETVQKLQDELKVVKTRNKKLCGILGAGEMREKAEILVQIEQLTDVKDELTEQVSELHTALEQERSKVHVLQTELKKYQNHRKDRRDSK